MEYLKVSTDSDYYLASVEIRNTILRKPLGMALSEEYLANEKKSNYHHFVAFTNKQVVSALSTRFNTDTIQICQIATLAPYQYQGVGKGLMLFAEQVLLTLSDINKFVVFSRQSSIDFYLKAGYQFVDDKIYQIVGLEHVKMFKLFFVKIDE